MASKEPQGLEAALARMADGPFGLYTELQSPSELASFPPSIRDFLVELVYTGRQLGVTDIGEQNPLFLPEDLEHLVGLASLHHIATTLLQRYEERLAQHVKVRTIARRDIPLPEANQTEANVLAYGVQTKATLLDKQGAFQITIPGKRRVPVVGKHPTLHLSYTPQTEDTRESVLFDVESTEGKIVFSSLLVFLEEVKGIRLLTRNRNIDELMPLETRLGTFDNNGVRRS